MKAWFDMFREALFTVLCNTLLQKREHCFCRKRLVWWRPFFFLLSVSRWSELCQEKFWFLSCMLSPPFLLPPLPLYCALRWICDAVNILNQVIVCVEICICVIKKDSKIWNITCGVSISLVTMHDVKSPNIHRGTWMKWLGSCVY